MRADQFCYWLKGYFELLDAVKNQDDGPIVQMDTLFRDQVEIIKNHLNLVFLHDIDPKQDKESGIDPEVSQAVHDGFQIYPQGSPFNPQTALLKDQPVMRC